MEDARNSEDFPETLPKLPKDFSKFASTLILIAIITSTFLLQIWGLKKIESSPDDCRLVESALLLIEGCPPHFGSGYGLTPSWLWAGALNIGLFIPYAGRLANDISAGRYLDLVGLLQQRRSFVFAYPMQTQIWLRLINAIASLGVVWLAYLIAFRIGGSRSIGLAAAALCAVNPDIAAQGLNFHPDQFQALFAAACLYFCIGEAEKRGDNQWLIAAIFCAASTATKPIAVTFWIPLMLSIYIRRRYESKQNILIAMIKASAIILLTYIVINPYIYTFPTHFFKGFAFQYLKHYGAESEKAGIISNMFFLLKEMARGMGYGLLGLAAIGSVYGLARRNMKVLILASAVLTYWLLLSTAAPARPHYIRYSFSIIAPLSVLAALAIFNIARVVPKRLSFFIAILLLFAGLAPLNTSLKIAKAREYGETRTIARNWILNNIPAGSRIFTDYCSPILDYDRSAIAYWKDYYAQVLINKNVRELPAEFFRDAILHEERCFYKRFIYLDLAEKLPAPGYDLMEMIYIPDDPRLVSESNRYWAVVTNYFFEEYKRRSLSTALFDALKKDGRLVKRVSNAGLVGDEIFIFKVEHESQ